MTRELDPFPFMLAEHLHKSLQEINDLPNLEIVQWRAWFKYRHAMGNPRVVKARQHALHA